MEMQMIILDFLKNRTQEYAGKESLFLLNKYNLSNEIFNQGRAPGYINKIISIF